jgi:hypothetical protein
LGFSGRIWARRKTWVRIFCKHACSGGNFGAFFGVDFFLKNHFFPFFSVFSCFSCFSVVDTSGVFAISWVFGGVIGKNIGLSMKLAYK